MKRWSPRAVVRTYAACFMSVTAPIAAVSFTQPVATPPPPKQEVLYADVPKVEPGPPPQATAVDPGEALAYLRIPRFGKSWLWVASEGTDMETLADGPGHFTGTALPGEVGNTAYAAHRSGYGEPFGDFHLLQPGDEIFVAQDGAEWTYEVTRHPTIIEPNEGWVVSNMRAGKWLTLVTCWPRYGAEKRYFVRARLTESPT